MSKSTKPFLERQLVPRQRIYLIQSETIDEDHFAAVFLETWKEIPAAARRKITAAANRDKYGLWVRVLHEMANPHHDGEASSGMLMISIAVRCVEYYTKAMLRPVIAHELAHIYDDLKCKGHRLEPIDITETRVQSIADGWGFPLHKPATEDYTPEEGLRISRNIQARGADLQEGIR